MNPVARQRTHHAPISTRRRRAIRRRLESLLSDPKGWPQESAPLRVRAGVMSNLAAQRQARTSLDRVTLYRESGWSGRRLQFSLRPPLAAAAVVAMIVSAAVHFMGGAEAWQPWANGLANRIYEVDQTRRAYGGSTIANAEPAPVTVDPGRTAAEALFSDVARFRDHMTGRLPTREAMQPSEEPVREPQPESPSPRRRNGPDPASS
jgi:hypothetical protein